MIHFIQRLQEEVQSAPEQSSFSLTRAELIYLLSDKADPPAIIHVIDGQVIANPFPLPTGTYGLFAVPPKLRDDEEHDNG